MIFFIVFFLCLDVQAFSFFPSSSIRSSQLTPHRYNFYQESTVIQKQKSIALKLSSSVKIKRNFLKLWSSKQNLAFNKIPTLINRKDLDLDFDSIENKHKLSLLTDFNNTISINSEELQSKWIDICIDENRPQDLNNFSLNRILPYILNQNTSFQITNRTLDHQQNIDESLIYITEQELKRLWEAKSIEPMGKSISKFNIDDSLLLLEDEDDFDIIGSSYSISINENVINDEVIEEPELIITLQELQRIWDSRAQITWGLPSQTFDEQSALLLLDTEEDDEDEPDVEYTSAAYDTDTTDDEEQAFWNKQTGKSFQLLRETLKRMKEDLDDTTYTRPAWKKGRNFLTPDIDTQEFMGDIMLSNTYLTQRIPANWDDPERDEMSDTYLSTGTMAWPGEEETDFNAKKHIWEELQLPFGPEYSQGLGLTFASLEEEEQEKITNTIEQIQQSTLENGDIDWSTFDFAKADTSSSETEVTITIPPTSEIDDFFSSFDASASSAQKDENNSEADAELALDSPRKRDNGLRSDSSKFTNLLAEPFVTPREWVENEEFRNHVGFEVWSNYPPTDFEAADDVWRDDDVYMAQSIKHVMTVTDEYLYDHLSFNEVNDEKRYWERVVWSSLSNQNYTEEEIPFYLTPDKDRGVKYSDEVIEMKGKITLHPFLDEPEIAFKDDVFTHNTELETLNKIGTIREQYDWQPRTELVHHIEEEKLERLQPLLKYANHVAILQSTKDNILIFEYRGLMRHLIGIRASMMIIAKECFPELEDLLLETTKTADKFDF